MPPNHTTKHAETYLHVYLTRHLTSMSQSMGESIFFSIPGGHFFLDYTIQKILIRIYIKILKNVPSVLIGKRKKFQNDRNPKR